ncbi:ComF family protein [Halovibrio sp. HP20-50]|uniref:ComF family protein n=1 Tax=Halovibrio sp. HP20-59 TaxID=3080275 RepID=UPI00294B80E8|nr:ComF family protein [Halovibrio sp. HP20-59]MEA2117354.1 ComF family protein [Halovibrio sp. HP20-59]
MPRKRWLQQGSLWLKRAMPGYCAFCLAPTEPGQGWCASCLGDLPWNRHACEQCGDPVSQGQPLCGHCLTDPPAFTRTQAGLLYQGAIKELLRDFKFQASPRAGILLYELMLKTPLYLNGATLLAVPMHPSHARERGFNQSYWLAKQLSETLGVPLVNAKRVKDSFSQRALNRRERAANLAGAFRLEAQPPEHIVIIDDVVTTGATGHALASAALEAGAERVDIWAIARTPLGKD